MASASTSVLPPLPIDGTADEFNDKFTQEHFDNIQSQIAGKSTSTVKVMTIDKKNIRERKSFTVTFVKKSNSYSFSPATSFHLGFRKSSLAKSLELKFNTLLKLKQHQTRQPESPRPTNEIKTENLSPAAEIQTENPYLATEIKVTPTRLRDEYYAHYSSFSEMLEAIIVESDSLLLIDAKLIEAEYLKLTALEVAQSKKKSLFSASAPAADKQELTLHEKASKVLMNKPKAFSKKECSKKELQNLAIVVVSHCDIEKKHLDDVQLHSSTYSIPKLTVTFTMCPQEDNTSNLNALLTQSFIDKHSVTNRPFKKINVFAHTDELSGAYHQALQANDTESHSVCYLYTAKDKS
ncbi:MAG: hypothetical protein ACPGUD_01225 [Parashewanella sp.]